MGEAARWLLTVLIVVNIGLTVWVEALRRRRDRLSKRLRTPIRITAFTAADGGTAVFVADRVGVVLFSLVADNETLGVDEIKERAFAELKARGYEPDRSTEGVAGAAVQRRERP